MKSIYQYGLKLWSTNTQYLEEAVLLYNKNIYSYIEIFVVPGSYSDYCKYWKNLSIPYVVHAPHFTQGLNFANAEKFSYNKKLAFEAFKFADELKSNKIIFHPGVNGDIKETVSQIKKIFDERIIIENKPYWGANKKDICVGNSVEEIKFVLNSLNVEFCLDISHAICSANAKNEKPLEFIKKFIKLKPKIYHLCDGDYNSVIDMHKHLKDGSFPLKEIKKLIPQDSQITIETDKNFDNSLNDFIEDVNSFNETN